MRYFLIIATKKPGEKANVSKVEEMVSAKALVDAYDQFDGMCLDGAIHHSYSCIIRDEDDAIEAVGRKLLAISLELNHEGGH